MAQKSEDIEAALSAIEELVALTYAKAASELLTASEDKTSEARMEIAAKAADFQALANRVAALKRGGGNDEAITIVTASNSGSMGPLSKGSLLPPVVGTIAAAGTDLKENARNPGLTYVTRDSAQVIAPSDGRVLFAGPYLSPDRS